MRRRGWGHLRVRRAGKRLLELINAVLDLSRIEAGRKDLYLETFSMPALASEIAAVIRPLADRNSNRVEVRCDPAVGEMRADLTNSWRVTILGEGVTDPQHFSQHQDERIHPDDLAWLEDR